MPTRDQLLERITWRLFAAGVTYPSPRRAAELVLDELEAAGVLVELPNGVRVAVDLEHVQPPVELIVPRANLGDGDGLTVTYDGRTLAARPYWRGR